MGRKDRFREGIGIEIIDIENLPSENSVNVENGFPSILPRKAMGKTVREGEPELGLFKRLILSFLGHVYVEHRVFPDWDGELPFYAFKCPIHGIVEDYPHGHNDRLECPKCRMAARVLKDLTFGVSRR